VNSNDILLPYQHITAPTLHEEQNQFQKMHLKFSE